MKLINLMTYLSENPYPGRGIILGRTADDKKAAVAYFIMGRSENSRNRVFETTEDGIRTRAFDESKMTDPSLIIYHPVRLLPNGLLVVTNGDQTDTIAEHIAQGHCYRHALNTRKFEPDGPNWTPRISGVLKPDGSYNLSILKSQDGNPDCCCRYFFEYDHPLCGVGHLIHTYQDNSEPLPSFEGEPRRVTISAQSAQSWAEDIWAALNEENKVSLFVQLIDLATQERDTVIINKHN
ncbi:MAG: inosine monophosphate cyclohydrolase [Lawsonibacter sp.]|nr:inosine monophosphate cyclohydrolase [Lawsonibacter sp.]